MKRSFSWRCNSLFFWLLLPPLLILPLLLRISEIDWGFVHFFEKRTPPNFVKLLYLYGCYPVVLCAIGLLLLACFYHWKQARVLAHRAFFYPLLLLLGAGVVVNGLKEVWGRPRPIQVVHQEASFTPFYLPQSFQIQKNQPYKSFPSGHAASGFSFFALMWLGVALQNRPLIYTGAISAFLLGGLLSYARMAALGHFFSDILGSFFIMYYLPPLLLLLLSDKLCLFETNSGS